MLWIRAFILKASTIEHCWIRSWLCLLVIWAVFKTTTTLKKGTGYVYNFCILISRYLQQTSAWMDATANSTCPFFCPDSSASANTTPAESRATAAAPVSTRSRGAPRLSTVRTNVSVSVRVQSQFAPEPALLTSMDNQFFWAVIVVTVRTMQNIPHHSAELLINMKDSHWLFTGRGCASFSCNFIVPCKA